MERTDQQQAGSRGAGLPGGRPRALLVLTDTEVPGDERSPPWRVPVQQQPGIPFCRRILGTPTRHALEPPRRSFGTSAPYEWRASRRHPAQGQAARRRRPTPCPATGGAPFPPAAGSTWVGSEDSGWTPGVHRWQIPAGSPARSAPMASLQHGRRQSEAYLTPTGTMPSRRCVSGSAPSSEGPRATGPVVTQGLESAEAGLLAPTPCVGPNAPDSAGSAQNGPVWFRTEAAPPVTRATGCERGRAKLESNGLWGPSRAGFGGAKCTVGARLPHPVPRRYPTHRTPRVRRTVPGAVLDARCSKKRVGKCEGWHPTT